MALQAVANISVDFYDRKYISINTKQLDKKTRFLSITCYSHGEPCPLNSGEHSAYVRYKKPDGYSVFNFCDINAKGKILVELTEQMLSVAGICYADLVIVNKGSAVTDKNTGEIVAINNTGILSTMPFHIDVHEAAFENSLVESSYEYDGLNDLMERAEADYADVILTSKSWAVGNTGVRSGENTDNAKFYAKQSSDSSSAANTSALNAANSEALAEEHMHDALTYSQNAQTYMGNAKTYMNNASASEANALKSEQNAKTSETNASVSENNAQTYMNDAEEYKDMSYDYSVIAQRYAVGGTNTESDEDIDNAKYYYEQARNIVTGNSVIGVKGSNETSYRTGNVNLTADNIGAVAVSDIATVDEVKDFLGIE
jgi:hypothetical protein